jgi:hypothetical protein
MKKKILAIMAFFMMLVGSGIGAQDQFDTGESINCEECCRQGRFVSRECCIKCNACTMYNDGAAAECNDYPM